jgi:hypothetical protein
MAKVGRPPSKDKKTKVLSVRLPNDLYERLREYTKINETSFSDVTINALEDWINSNK